MITFVYCCICLLIVCCQTTKIESEENDYSNDSPDTLPKVKILHYRSGSDVVLKCNKHHPNKDNISWEFKNCRSNNRGIHCDYKTMYTLDYGEGEWKKLDYSRKRKKLEIKNVTSESVGLYRCLYNDSIIKIYLLDLVVPAKYVGPPPEILSLVPSSNSTVPPSTPLVIQCKATSVVPPEMRWFKECNALILCEKHLRVPYNGNCYCTIPESNYAHSIINNTYISKLSIYNTRNVDSGTYICLIMSVYGEDHQNITVKVDDMNSSDSSEDANSFSLLFLIPLFFVLVPVIIWLGFYRRKKKNRRQLSEHQKQLIKPVVEVDIVLNVDDVVKLSHQN